MTRITSFSSSASTSNDRETHEPRHRLAARRDHRHPPAQAEETPPAGAIDGRVVVTLGGEELAVRQLGAMVVYLEGIDVLSHQFWEFMAFPDSLQAQARFSLPA